MRILAAGVLLAVLGSFILHRPGSAQPLNPAAPIAVVGDSVAYGAYDVVRGGWVTRLQLQLDADYPRANLRILNAARNGGNFGDLPRTLRWVHQHTRPSLVIIAYGLNDFDEHVSTHAFAAHIYVGLSTLRGWTPAPAVILMGMPPITALSPAQLRLERAYTDIIRHTAWEEGVGYLDEFDFWLALGPRFLHTLRHDTEHPNRFGYSFTAATVAAFLEGAYLDSRGRIHPPTTAPACDATVCGS